MKPTKKKKPIALAGVWIPALVFGIPGYSITAIIIGVLYMKNMAPGPTLFTQNPQNIYAVYLLFIVANIMMVPLGFACIKVSKQILRVPREILMPVILLFCIVGTFAINNTVFDVGIMLIAGVVAYAMEESYFLIGGVGVVLGGDAGAELRHVANQERRQHAGVLRAPGRGDARRADARRRSCCCWSSACAASPAPDAGSAGCGVVVVPVAAATRYNSEVFA